MSSLSRTGRRARQQRSGAADHSAGGGTVTMEAPQDIHFLVAKKIMSRHDGDLDRDEWDPLDHGLVLAGGQRTCGCPRHWVMAEALAWSLLVVLMQTFIVGILAGNGYGGGFKLCRQSDECKFDSWCTISAHPLTRPTSFVGMCQICPRAFIGFRPELLCDPNGTVVGNATFLTGEFRRFGSQFWPSDRVMTADDLHELCERCTAEPGRGPGFMDEQTDILNDGLSAGTMFVYVCVVFLAAQIFEAHLEQRFIVVLFLHQHLSSPTAKESKRLMSLTNRRQSLFKLLQFQSSSRNRPSGGGGGDTSTIEQLQAENVQTKAELALMRRAIASLANPEEKGTTVPHDAVGLLSRGVARFDDVDVDAPAQDGEQEVVQAGEEGKVVVDEKPPARMMMAAVVAPSSSPAAVHAGDSRLHLNTAETVAGHILQFAMIVRLAMLYLVVFQLSQFLINDYGADPVSVLLNLIALLTFLDLDTLILQSVHHRHRQWLTGLTVQLPPWGSKLLNRNRTIFWVALAAIFWLPLVEMDLDLRIWLSVGIFAGATWAHVMMEMASLSSSCGAIAVTFLCLLLASGIAYFAVTGPAYFFPRYLI